ncbi:hypothetical protein KC19_7G010200 [Ceratodon purpureus]|uniref:Kinesin motor domain-containing protein n=1 Tax=Ceratodon purpureus TaxID=3225 RepID=A0A8T0H3D8_CERPU|nr:hypothetical protein KC19_7G010200 [Ceratodon purpureus]
MNPLRLFSKVASASPKKLSFDAVCDSHPGAHRDHSPAPAPEPSRSASLSPFVVTTRGDPKVDPLSPCELLITGIASSQEDFDVSPPSKVVPAGGTRKRCQSSASEAGSPVGSKAPTPGKGKKTTPGHLSGNGQRGQQSKGHHHRRSLSNFPRLDNGSSDFPVIPPGRMLRQSASFSGISTTRGGRPPTSGEMGTPLSGSLIPAPRSAGKAVRYAGSGARAKSMGNGDELRIELEEDPEFWQDHSVQVLIRARPISSAEVAQYGVGRCVKQENAHTVTWLGQPETRFTFDHVAGEFVTQEELFRVAGLPMVDNCMAGYNSCMFAYGQTGSGKTHTMLGDIGDVDQQPNENRGMTPRVFEYLFAKIQQEEEAQKHEKLKYKCRCSFLEIYNEQVSDLLEPSSTNLQMREDSNKGVYVEGLLEVEVQNVQDVLHLLLLGATNRKVAATNMNRESSRSHSVFTCVIESQWECDSMINFRFGRLNLVDLAGSERQKATGADGERLREAASINKSLSTLGLVIMVLVDVANGKQRHVPYRDSKLTFLLQDSLGGNSKTTIIANISPSTCASSETLSTLKFAQRAKFIQNNAVINEEASGDVKGLQEQIQQLKDELARIRRQSISRIPSVRVSDPNGDLPSNESSGDSKDPLFDPLRSSTEGSFLQFSRAVLGPTALSHKIKTMETLLADSLRREKLLVKTSAAEIDHLTRLVKQREDETCFHKTLLESGKHKIRRLDGPSDSSDSSDYKSAASAEESEDEICNNPDHMRLAVDNSVLQEQLRRAKEYDAFEDRETMSQDISNLREKLLEMLDRNNSMESAAFPQQEALMAELAAERQAADLLRNEVESYQRDLSECRMKLQTSLEANERMASEMDTLRMELESSQEDCRKHRQELGTLQIKALEVESLELKQAQHQQFMLELKTQLQKSEEKAEQEASRRSQLEQQLQEALQESTNLQTELQWTRDSLEEAEAQLETLQRNEPVLEIGDPEGSYEAFMIGQLQAEIIDMHSRLEDERKRGRELEEQIANQGIQITENEKHHKRNLSTDSCDATGKRRVRHHDAIMQLQMELETLDGGSPSASDAIKGYRWEDGTRDDEAETKHTVTIMQLQLDMEALECALTEEKASSAVLKQRLDETETKLNVEKAKVEALKGNGNVTDVEGKLLQFIIKEEEMAKMQDALSVAREHFNLEKQTLMAAVADVEERYNGVKKDLDSRQEELKSLEERTQRAEARELADHAERLKLEEELKKHLGAVHILADDLQNQIEQKEKEIVKLKEQTAQEQEDWCLEKSDLLVAVRESEARCVEKNLTIKNLQRSLASMHTNFYDDSLFESAQGLRNQKMAQLEKKLQSVTEAMEQLSSENTLLQGQIQVLRTETDDARKLVGLKEEELAWVQKRLTNANESLEQESTKMKALSLSISEAACSEENWRDARELLSLKIAESQSFVGFPSKNTDVELARTQVLLAGSEGKVKLLSDMVEKMRNDSIYEKDNFSEHDVDLVKSTDRPLRELSENRKLRLSDGNMKVGEKVKHEVARMRAEIANLRSKVQEKDNTILNVRMQLSSATTSCKEMEVLIGKTVTEKENNLQLQLQAAVEEAVSFKVQVQQCEAEMERLTMLLLEVQERHTKAEQSWMAEKVQLEIHRHEAELQAATKKLKLPARFAKIDKWQRQLSEADKLMNMLVVANEKSKQDCSVASAEADMADKLIQELLETVSLTKEQVDSTMGHAEEEIRALIAETQLLKTDLRRDILNLRKAKPVLVDEVKRSMEILPSVKCLESERRSWEQQCKAANAMLTEKEATIRSLHDEVNKARQQTWSVQSDQGATVRALQEKEDTIRKLLNEINQLKQSIDRNMSLRQSFTKEAADFGHYSTPLKQNSLRQSLSKETDSGLEFGPTPLRRSFSLKLIEEKEMTLNVLQEEKEYLKTMVFSLDTENAELQQQLLDFEADSTALKSTISNLQRELDDSNRQRSEDVALLDEQLKESTRHISELECQRKELRDEMQRQAVSFAALYEQLQKQENIENMVRTDECKAAENKEVLQILEEEKAELKFMVERLDAEMMAHQAESKQLQLQVRALQDELDYQKLQLKDVLDVRAKLETDLARKSDETAVVSRELHLLRTSAEKLARETENLRNLVGELERDRIHLEGELRCAGDSRSKVDELEMEKDKLQDDLNLFMEQLEMIQAIADERDVAAAEAHKMAEVNKTLAEEKQVEVEILGRSVEELENTVYALESQVGLLKRECERQRLMREELESEMQGLKDQISYMHTALTEASTRSGDELLETKLRREDAERMLEERESEMQQLRKKLEKFQMGLEGARAGESPEPQLPAQAAPVHKLQKAHRSTGSSAFGCMKLNHQMHLEIDEERKGYERRIQELEDVLDNHQSEVTMLHEKLADAERMTRDVLRVLRGVKLDMANVATLLNDQQVEEGMESDKRTLQKDEEIENILTRLNDFIEERESWLEMLSRKQADLVASQAAVEKLREREKTLVAENKKLKGDNRMQLKKIGLLEQEIKTLSGQQNLQQRIKHHAKIKDENNSLRIQNNELSAKLRRAEHLNTRISEELAKYRTAQGKSSALNIEEEQRLRIKLQEVEEQRDQEVQKLVSLCSSVMKTAGIVDDDNKCTEPAVALEAVEEIKERLESTVQEFEDFKLKTRIMGERQRLNEMRTAHSPLRGIDPSVSPR